MSDPFFLNVKPISFSSDAPDSSLVYRYYDKDRSVGGRRMEDFLRVAVCYWHTLNWSGADTFGDGTFDRPFLNGDPMEGAARKADVAFELFSKLGVRYYTFHDRDVAPEGRSIQETNRNLDRVTERLLALQETTGIRPLWGTANLFGNPRYMAGAATNPDPEVFAYAAAQVRKALDVTKALKGENYVLWGGREGYETLLNTDMKRELAQLARFLKLVVDYKHKIGFRGMLLIEPKPKEPTKHQYDFDAATVHAFLGEHGLDKEFKLNLEANHAILAGHSFEHELEYSRTHGLLGSVDINRGDSLLGWDTDQFPNDPLELALAMTSILKNGGLGSGGFNFDAKLRRQSVARDDLLHAHVGGIDTLARSVLIAERILGDGKLQALVDERYAGWRAPLGRQIMESASLEELADMVAENGINPAPRSGRQEMIENLVQRYLT
jgi:xylose isomerase